MRNSGLLIMKIISLLLCFSFAQASVWAQETYDKNLESLLGDNPRSSEARFKYALRNEFSRVINANTNGVIGNYVGFSTKDKTLSFAYNFIRENSVLEINFAGGINEGIAKIFSNNEFNTGVKVGLKYNWLFGCDNIRLDYTHTQAIKRELKKIDDDWELYKINLQIKKKTFKEEIEKKQLAYKRARKNLGILYAGEDESSLDKKKENSYKIQKKIIQTEMSLLKKKIKGIDLLYAVRLEELRKKRSANLKKDPYAADQFRVDSLKLLNHKHELEGSLEIKKKEFDGINKKSKENTFDQISLEKAELALKKAEQELNIAKEKYSIDNNRQEFIEKTKAHGIKRRKVLEKINGIRAESIELKWLSIGGAISNETYNLFDTSRPESDRIYKEDDIVPSLSISFTQYKNKLKSRPSIPGTHGISFFTIGASIQFGNNLNSLSQIKIETADSISVNQLIVNSLTAYQGTFKDEVVTSQIFTDYYYFGDPKNRIGLHLRGTFDMGPFAPVTSIRCGLLLSAIKKEDFKSFLNFEIFYGLNNIFQDGGEETLLSRNILGIQTTIPFSQ